MNPWDFRSYKYTSPPRRIALCMGHFHFDSFGDYRAFLETPSQEPATFSTPS